MRILHVASEVYPLMKTGGLADVCASLPAAQRELGHDARIVMPAYADAVAIVEPMTEIASCAIEGLPDPVRILETHLPKGDVPVWLVDYPPAFWRPGNPYQDADGHPWADNAERFATLCRAAVEIARNRAGLDWQPDIVHCHDWQTGLVAPLLGADRNVKTVFTIHNLAYQGLFPREVFEDLGLAEDLWGHDGLEFHGAMSFIKGGIIFNDWLTTVSPTYAKEIQTIEFGCGLDDLLQQRSDRLIGIVNGIDEREWDPSTDRWLTHHYDADQLHLKYENKRELSEEKGLQYNDDVVLVGLVSRLVEQKGIDLVIQAIPHLMDEPVRFVILGTGQSELERQLMDLAIGYHDYVSVAIGYDEGLAHRIEASADIFLMPSRFEPCGLSQMYSLRYGTVPIVRNTGGLTDTVIHADPLTLADGNATGIVFSEATSTALVAAVQYALKLYHQGESWQRMMKNGMRRDVSWGPSARAYLKLYAR
jgi:starch synthase